MNTPVYLVPIALPPPSASWHFNRKRNPWDSNDPCGAKVRDPSIFMDMNSTKSADKLEYTRYMTYFVFGFILPSLTSLDDPHIVARLAEPNNFSYEFYLPIR